MKLIRAGLITLALAMLGLFVMPIQEAAAATTCKVTTVNGYETKRVCTTKRRSHYREPYYKESSYRNRNRTRTVCNTYWRHGVKHRHCRQVRRY